jgi:urease subunit alpha
MDATCVTFVSQAAVDGGIGKRLGLRRRLLPVRGCRGLTKRHMLRNAALPRIEVDPETYEVRVDGELATCEPASRLSHAQLYYIV